MKINDVKELVHFNSPYFHIPSRFVEVSMTKIESYKYN